MNRARGQPDAQSHHAIKLDQKVIDINFCYYSPKKSASIESVASQEQIPTFPFSDPSEAMEVFEGKISRGFQPHRESEKFYEVNFADANISLLNYYEKFHSRLLEHHKKQAKPQNKKPVIKINLSQQTKKAVFQTERKGLTQRISRNQQNKNKNLKLETNRENRPVEKYLVKRAYINLSSSSLKQKKMRSLRIEDTEKENRRKYETEEKDSQRKLLTERVEVYRTPLQESSRQNRRGITVISSTSTKKNRNQSNSRGKHDTEEKSNIVLKKEANSNKKIKNFSTHTKKLYSVEKLKETNKPKFKAISHSVRK